jgi:hypothetical protein
MDRARKAGETAATPNLWIGRFLSLTKISHSVVWSAALKSHFPDERALSPATRAAGRHFAGIADESPPRHRFVVAVILGQMDTPEQIPDHVRAAFAARPFMGLTSLARALGWDLLTLRGHVDAGRLVGRRKGHGRVRTHLVFTIEDFKQFWERLAEPAATPTVVHLPTPQKRQRPKPTPRWKRLMAQRRRNAGGSEV